MGGVNLLLLNDELNTSIEEQGGKKFLDHWKRFCWIYDISTFDFNVLKSNREFFNDFSMSYSVSKEILKNNLDKDVFEELDKFMSEIEQNK